MAERKILFSVHKLQRLRLDPGFPREEIPALHVCPDGLLFKDSFLPFDEVAAVEAPEELSLSDSRLAGHEAAIPMAAGHGCLVLRGEAGVNDTVFIAPDAPSLRDRLNPVWREHKSGLPQGWRRLKDDGFSLCCPTAWRTEEASHPNLKLRLYSPLDGVMANILVYERDGGTDLASVVSALLADLREQYDDLHIRGREKVQIDGMQGERLVVEERSARPPVVSDTYLLMAPKQIVEIQFLLPADRYDKNRPTLEKVALAFRCR